MDLLKKFIPSKKEVNARPGFAPGPIDELEQWEGEGGNPGVKVRVELKTPVADGNVAISAAISNEHRIALNLMQGLDYSEKQAGHAQPSL